MFVLIAKSSVYPERRKKKIKIGLNKNFLYFWIVFNRISLLHPNAGILFSSFLFRFECILILYTVFHDDHTTLCFSSSKMCSKNVYRQMSSNSHLTKPIGFSKVYSPPTEASYYKSFSVRTQNISLLVHLMQSCLCLSFFSDKFKLRRTKYILVTINT